MLSGPETANQVINAKEARNNNPSRSRRTQRSLPQTRRGPLRTTQNICGDPHLEFGDWGGERIFEPEGTQNRGGIISEESVTNEGLYKCCLAVRNTEDAMVPVDNSRNLSTLRYFTPVSQIK